MRQRDQAAAAAVAAAAAAGEGEERGGRRGKRTISQSMQKTETVPKYNGPIRLGLWS